MQLNQLKMLILIKYKYSGYGIGFGRRGTFSVPSGGFGNNVTIFMLI